MKRTDIDRQDRELRKSQKKEEVIKRSADKKTDRTVGDYINELYSYFFHDDNKIFNITQSEDILEILDDIKTTLPEKQWENVIRKAVKKTPVKEREAAVKELKGILDEL
jgi:hypothetical protein